MSDNTIVEGTSFSSKEIRKEEVDRSVTLGWPLSLIRGSSPSIRQLTRRCFSQVANYSQQQLADLKSVRSVAYLSTVVSNE